MARVDDNRRADCGETLRGLPCDLVKGHDGEHQAVLRWEPKLVGRAAVIDQIKTQGIHLHATTKAARAWKLVTRKPKTPCIPEQCIKFTNGGGGVFDDRVRGK